MRSNPASRVSLLTLLAALIATGCGGNGHTRTRTTTTTVSTSVSMYAAPVETTNATVGQFSSASAMNISKTGSILTVTISDTAQGVNRTVRVLLPENAKAGDDFLLGHSEGAEGSIFYDETKDGTTRHWIGAEGTLHVNSATPGNASVELSVTQFDPTDDAGNTATGSFTLRGSANQQ